MQASSHGMIGQYLAGIEGCIEPNITTDTLFKFRGQNIARANMKNIAGEILSYQENAHEKSFKTSPT